MSIVSQKSFDFKVHFQSVAGNEESLGPISWHEHGHGQGILHDPEYGHEYKHAHAMAWKSNLVHASCLHDSQRAGKFAHGSQMA